MRTNRNMRLSTAIRLALGTGLAATMAIVPVATAAEDAAQLERVQVTGSRISRLDIEGATPVVTITREDLDNSGFQSVADFLRSNSFNSFGSFRESSGYTAQGQATLSLRGIGSSRTLVLIDGKRLPGSPVLNGQIQNLNTIPFAAVERIEILSDGASAVYGSDAIGGVVNVILRKDFEGGQVTVRGTDPRREGGEERGISIVSGFGGDRGRLTFAMEADHKGIVKSADRYFTAGNDLDGPSNHEYSELVNWSIHGRSIQNPGFQFSSMISTGHNSAPTAGDTACNVYGSGYEQPVNEWFGGAFGNVCAYDFTLVAANTASLDRLSTFMDAEYEINSDLTFYARTLATRVESFGRYAPAAGAFRWRGPDLAAENITYQGNPYTLQPLNNGAIVRYRFDNAGPARDTTQTDYQFDLQTGLQGFYRGVQWNLGYQYDLYDMKEWGDGYVNVMGLNAGAQAGWDPRHPNQAQFADLVADMRENSNREAQMKMQRVDVGAQFDGPMMSGGPVMFFVGGEYRDEEYFDQTQRQLEAGNVIGSAGGTSGGSRSNWATFAEASLPITSTFELNPAVRFDSYNDFGTEITYKLSGRWQPTDYLVVRGSYGTGFRAPSLDMLYQAPSQSFSFASNLVDCQTAGVSISDCITGPSKDLQWETNFNNNPNLDAETSSQYLLGTVLNLQELINTDLTLSLDYYHIKIKDQLQFLSTQDAFWLEYLGLIDQVEGVDITRDAGAFVIANVGPVNFSSFDTRGIDFRANWAKSFGAAGDLKINFQSSYILKYNASDVIVGPAVNQTGRRDAPKYRLDLDVAYTLGRHTVALHSYYIPGQCEDNDLNPNFDGTTSTLYFVCVRDDDTNAELRVSSYTHHNLIYSFEAPWNARISFGVNNLTDKDPVLDSALGYDSGLYPVVSRAYVASYTQRF